MEQPKLLDAWIAAATENPILSLGHRTSIVAKIKYLLGLAAALLLASLILWPLLYPVDQPLKLTFNAVETKEAEPKVMVNPRFHGIDKYNRPFNIRAAEAFQQSETMVTLKHINGDIAMENGSWLMVQADAGEAETSSRKLRLTGSVKVFSSDGYEITTPEANIDLNTATGQSDKPIQAQGPLGLLRGNGFFLDINEQKLNIAGRVHLTIYPQKAP